MCDNLHQGQIALGAGGRRNARHVHRHAPSVKPAAGMTEANLGPKRHSVAEHIPLQDTNFGSEHGAKVCRCR